MNDDTQSSEKATFVAARQALEHRREKLLKEVEEIDELLGTPQRRMPNATVKGPRASQTRKPKAETELGKHLIKLAGKEPKTVAAFAEAAKKKGNVVSRFLNDLVDVDGVLVRDGEGFKKK